MAAATLEELVRLNDHSFYADDPYAVYDRLRREAPVFWYEAGRCWVVAKYDDVRSVARNSSFSVAKGPILGDNLMPERAGGLLPGETLLMTDPPRHTKLRRVVSKAFSPRTIALMEDRIRALVIQSLDDVETGEVADFVSRISAPLPALVMAELLGIPKEDQESFVKWTDALFYIPDIEEPADLAEAMCNVAEVWQYFMASVEARRQSPGPDLVSLLIESEVDGERLSEDTLLNFCLVVLIAGIETTRSLISGSVHTLAGHPAQRRLLTENPPLIPAAIEECLRWVTPVNHMARTATEDVLIGQQPVAAGDFVLMLFASANRDEDAWRDAGRFDIQRSPDPAHVAFGFGEHTCLGAALARLEVRILFEELLKRFPNYSLANPPTRVQTVFLNALATLPIVFE